jgi:hypothetical protein
MPRTPDREDAMDAMAATPRSRNDRHASRAPTEPPPLELWRIRGETDDLRGLAIETSFGYALGLELDHERILVLLQPSLDVLVAYADRIESALLAKGWRRIAPCPHTKEHP